MSKRKERYEIRKWKEIDVLLLYIEQEGSASYEAIKSQQVEACWEEIAR